MHSCLLRQVRSRHPQRLQSVWVHQVKLASIIDWTGPTFLETLVRHQQDQNMFTSTIPTQQIDDMSNAAMGGASWFHWSCSVVFGCGEGSLFPLAGDRWFRHWRYLSETGSGLEQFLLWRIWCFSNFLTSWMAFSMLISWLTLLPQGWQENMVFLLIVSFGLSVSEVWSGESDSVIGCWLFFLGWWDHPQTVQYWTSAASWHDFFTGMMKKWRQKWPGSGRRRTWTGRTFDWTVQWKPFLDFWIAPWPWRQPKSDRRNRISWQMTSFWLFHLVLRNSLDIHKMSWKARAFWGCCPSLG